jgi:methylamine dehydrogenase heavy chain
LGFRSRSAFNSLPDGRAAIVDVGAENNNVLGQIPVSQFGSLLPSTTRGEIYVGETFHSRLTRGERTDVITIWDTKTLTPKDEIVLPGGKRGLFVTLRNSLQLTNGEKWALVFNFTPGSSVTVVDLDARKILSDIDLPGCSLTYPTGPRGFTSLCADGTMTSIALDAAGKPGRAVTSKPFNDIDDNPLFMTPAMVGQTGWFVSFKGDLRAIDFSGPAARDLGGFALPKQDGGTPEWRPGGWQVITADRAGLLYVLMNPNGGEGTHKDGGTEVWVADPRAKALVRRIPLKNHSLSIEATQQEKPLLVAARPDGSLDVYDAATGSFVRTIVSVVHDPMTMTAVR